MAKAHFHSEVAFVEVAMRSLRYRATRAQGCLAGHFARAFNDWYCPAVRRGYRGPMTLTYDLGMLLARTDVGVIAPPPAGGAATGETGYARGLRELAASRLLADAREILKQAPNGNRPQAEWILVEALLRQWQGVWGPGEVGVPPLPYLPHVEACGDRTQVSVRRAWDSAELGQVSLALAEEEVPRGFKYPQPVVEPGALDTSDRVRLFMAYVACRSLDAADRLDYEVVEACLRGPNLRTQEHEPPPQHRTELEFRRVSTLPGLIAGITRPEVKQPDDRIVDVLPAELALWLMNKQACLWHLLNGGPLVNKHENQQDLVPRHRALVCFITACGAGGAVEPMCPAVHGYRHRYVYAKRQVFDLVRDLRNALELVRARASVEIDVAIAQRSAHRENIVVHRQFSLMKMPSRIMAQAAHDRLEELMNFNGLAPEFLERASPERYSPRGSDTGRLDCELGQFLRSMARHYHAIHLVPIGSMHDARAFVHAAGCHDGVRHRHMVIIVDPRVTDSDPRLALSGEPAWHLGQARTAREALSLLSTGNLLRTPLEKLRQKFICSILGDIKGKGAKIQRMIQLA